MSEFGAFFRPTFPVLRLIKKIFSPNTGKCTQEKALNSDSFCAAMVSMNSDYYMRIPQKLHCVKEI